MVVKDKNNNKLIMDNINKSWLRVSKDGKKGKGISIDGN
jgi:hypothetical protein